MLPRTLRIAVFVVALVVTVALLAAIVVWKTRQEAVAERLESIVQEFLVANDSTRIEISRVSGNPLGSLTLHDASLLVRDGDEWRTFIKTRRATARYKISQLSLRGIRLESVEFVEPVITFPRGAGGQYLWPRFGDGSPPDSGSVFSIAIDRVSVRRGEWRIEGEQEDVVMNDVSLDGSFGSDETGTWLNQLQLRLSTAPWECELESLTGNIRFRDGIVEAESIGVRTPKSYLKLEGRLATWAGGEARLDAVLEEFAVSEARVFEALSFLPEEGTLAGELKIEREQDGPTRVESSVRGTYGSHLIETLDLVSTSVGRKWENQFHAKTDGSVLEGMFNTGPGEAQECRIDFMNLDPGAWPELFGPVEIPHGSVSGRFTFSGKLLTSPGREGEVDLFLYGGEYAGLSFMEGNATGSFGEGGDLVISEIDLLGAGYSVGGEGTIGANGDVSIGLAASLTSLSGFEVVRDVFDFDGRVMAQGGVSGTIDSLTLDVGLAGEIERTIPPVVSGTAKNMRVRGTLVPSVHLQVETVLGPAELVGVALDSLTVSSELRWGVEGNEVRGLSAAADCEPVMGALEARVQGVAGDSSVSAEATIVFCEEGARAVVDKVVGDLGRSRWRNERPMRLRWGGGTLRVEDMEISSGESKVALGGTYETEGKRFRGKLDVRSLDVGATVGGLLPLGGELDANVTFGLEESGPAMTVEVDWLNASAADREVDRVSVSAKGEGEEFIIERFELAKGRGNLRASGRVFLPEGIQAVFDSLVSRGSMPSGIDVRMNVATSDLNMADFSSWHPSLEFVGGVIDARATIEGKLENPGITLSLNARDLRLREYRLAGLSADVTLSDSVCSVSKLELIEHHAKGEVSGFFPVSLDIRTGRVSFPDAPIGLSIRLSESDFAVATLFVKQFASCSGVTQGEAELTGTLERPVLRGGFELRNATLRLAGREETLRDLEAQVALSEEALELVRCTAKLGEGRLEGSGRIQLSGDRRGQYEFFLKGRKVTMGDPEDIALKGDCQLTISSVDMKDRGTYAQITGRVDVRQGVIAREFQASSGPHQEQRWLCDIELDIPNNLWLKNTNAEIELAGSLTARKDISGLVLLGSLRILRGKYYVFDNEFRISSGTLEFRDVGTIDPEMNIEAETRTSGRRVFLALSGKLSEPNIRLSSEDPNLSQTEIVRLLTVGKYVASGPGEGSEGGLVPGVTGSVGNYFLRQVERRLARDLTWVDSIEFGSGREGNGSLSELRWGLGKYITPELYLRYSQGLTKTSERDVSVEYRLSELLFLRGEVVSRDRLSGREKDEYNLDLRLKYEY